MNNSHIIVVGNEKGGAGKTTTSVHLIVYLLKIGFKVCCLDLDIRQKSTLRFFENRQNYKNKNNIDLALPEIFEIDKSITTKTTSEVISYLDINFENLKQKFDFIVVDTPGSDTVLSRYAHSHADTVITPVNDSFMDLDVLGQFDYETIQLVRPSIYSETIWQQKMIRAKKSQKELSWYIIRNRMSNLEAKNKQRVGVALSHLSKKLGANILNGFKERVIFRELFLHGLTVLDLNSDDSKITLSTSHLAAREELKNFLRMLKISALQEKLKEV